MKLSAILAHFPRITLNRYRQLSGVFCSFEELKKASFNDIRTTVGHRKAALKIYNWIKSINPIELEQNLSRHDIETICFDDNNYPAKLKTIYDPPLCLFVRGKLYKKETALAVVGSRKYSQYGHLMTEKLIAPISTKLTIVSGLALGIDAISHRTTLKAGGRTIAVLGGGIDKLTISPTANQCLAEQIVLNGGAVISEYPPGTKPTKFTFPERNRLIAGLSVGTLVIEAGKKSGTLITAAYALESGLEVMAVPHNATNTQGIGCNNLIKQGAHIVTCSEDIQDILNLPKSDVCGKNIDVYEPNSIENQIIKSIDDNGITIDELSKKTEIGQPKLNSTLTLMEIENTIKNIGGVIYKTR